MKSFISAFKNYAEFGGRTGRKEFWSFFLFHCIFLGVSSVLDMMFGTESVFFYIYVLVLFIPYLAIQTRRLHDIGKSGWFLLLSLIPIIGQIFLLGLFCIGSQNGENKYDHNIERETGNRKNLSIVVGVVLAIVVSVGVILSFVRVVAINGNSMSPTLEDGSRLIVSKIHGGFPSLSKGDIVIIDAKKELLENGKRADYNPLIRRIIAVEGEKIEIKAGKVYINNILLYEPYVNGVKTNTSKDINMVVPEGKIFVMGDERASSEITDSRLLGAIDKNKVLYKGIFNKQ
jgi:signal peptidase I